MNHLNLSNLKQVCFTLFLIICGPSLAEAAIEIGNVINPNPGAADGLISVRLSGRASPFTIRLDGPVSYSESNADEPLHTFEGLSSGNYTITVTDKQGCMTVLSYDLEEFICDIVFNITNIKHASYCSDNIACGDQKIEGCTRDGYIEFDVMSSNNYEVYINQEYMGDNITEIDNLGSDDYLLEIVNKSSSDCRQSKSFQILFCTQFEYVDNEVLVSTNGSSSRNLGNCQETEGNVGSQFLDIETLKVEGATGGICNGELVFEVQSNLGSHITYIKNSQDERWYGVTSLSNLCPDNYCLVVDDGCMNKQVCRRIGDCEENPVVLNPQKSNPCVGTSKGQIYLNVESGFAPYTFNWNNGSTEQDLENIPAGIYAVTVTDYKGCQASTEIVLEEEPMTMTVEIDVKPFTEYSSVGEIVITANGPEEVYSLFVDGFEYFPLQNGVTKILEFEESKSYLIEVFSSTGCGYEEEVLLTDCQNNDFDKLEIEVFRSDDKICNGGSQLIDVVISGGSPPYRIDAATLSQSFGADPIFEETKTVFENGIISSVFSIPVGRTDVRITDACGSIVSEGITICGGNCFVYSEVKSSDEIEYFVTDFLKFKVARGCFSDGCIAISGCSRVIVEFQEGAEDNYRLTNRLEFLKIIWPDGRTTGVEIDALSGGGSIRRLKFVGTNGFLPPAPGEYTIKVEWTPEYEAKCTMEFDVQFLDGGIPTIGFFNNGDFNFFQHEPYKSSYIGTFTCESCLPSSTAAYVNDANQCRSDNIGPSIEFFRYQPANINNPCNGGGIIQTYAYVNGEIELTTIPVPPNIAIDGLVSRFLVGGEVQGVDAPNDICTFGGRCLFEAIDIFGVELDKPIGVGWCESQGVYVPPPGLDDPPTDDSGEDDSDVGDVIDEEEDCISTIVRADDDNCDMNTYCIRADGSEILLSWEDGPNVTICRFETRSGNCTSLRGRCNCQPEVTNGQEFVRIEDPTLCNDMSIPTCTEYHAANNCQGPNGQGTGGTGGGFTGENPNENSRYITASDEKFPITRKIYPNPFTHEVNISLTSEINKELIFSISDVYGVIIYEDYREVVQGHNTFTFTQLANYPNGIYYIAVYDDLTGEIEVKKVVKASFN